MNVSNGLDWSADGATFYYVDTQLALGRLPLSGIDAFAYDVATGRLSERRRVVTIEPSLGLPDGLTVDEEGCLWLALFGGGAVHRYRPDGALDAVLPLPVSLVTSCAFGGPDLQDLYVTSAAHRLRREEPLAGSLFVCRPGPRGRPPSAFAG